MWMSFWTIGPIDGLQYGNGYVLMVYQILDDGSLSFFTSTGSMILVVRSAQSGCMYVQ